MIPVKSSHCSPLLESDFSNCKDSWGSTEWQVCGVRAVTAIVFRVEPPWRYPVANR
jgi:hypothetical protein